MGILSTTTSILPQMIETEEREIELLDEEAKLERQSELISKLFSFVTTIEDNNILKEYTSNWISKVDEKTLSDLKINPNELVVNLENDNGLTYSHIKKVKTQYSDNLTSWYSDWKDIRKGYVEQIDNLLKLLDDGRIGNHVLPRLDDYHNKTIHKYFKFFIDNYNLDLESILKFSKLLAKNYLTTEDITKDNDNDKVYQSLVKKLNGNRTTRITKITATSLEGVYYSDKLIPLKIKDESVNTSGIYLDKITKYMDFKTILQQLRLLLTTDNEIYGIKTYISRIINSKGLTQLQVDIDIRCNFNIMRTCRYLIVHILRTIALYFNSKYLPKKNEDITK